MANEGFDFGPDVVLGKVTYLHPSALIYGKVSLGDGVSVWPHVVIRAEMYEVVVGAGTNLQDFVMVHVGDYTPTSIGANCSITHHATIHGCTIGDNCLIGIGATIMDGCVVGENSIVGGGSFLKPGTIVPPNSIVMGVPGKVTRQANNWIKNRFNAFMYQVNGQAYANGNHRIWSDPVFLQAAESEMARLEREFQKLFPSAES